MLVLPRQKDETIMIGDDVEITVVDIRGDKVRLGIKAPPHIPVHRKEVYEAIKRENRAASQVSPDDLKSVATSKGTVSGPATAPPATPNAGQTPPADASESLERDARTQGRGKPADSNNTKSNSSKSVTPGCEGTQSTGS